MKTRIQKWGRSLALRIPKTLADEVGLKSDSPVEVSALKGNWFSFRWLNLSCLSNSSWPEVTSAVLHKVEYLAARVI